MSSAFKWAKEIVESSTGITGINVAPTNVPPPPPPPQRPIQRDNQDARGIHQQQVSTAYNYNIHNQHIGGYSNMTTPNLNPHYQNHTVYGSYDPTMSYPQPNYYNTTAVNMNYGTNSMVYNPNNYQSQAMIYPPNGNYTSQQMNITPINPQHAQVSTNSYSANTTNTSNIPKTTNVVINNNNYNKLLHHNTTNGPESTSLKSNTTTNAIVWPDSLKEFVENVFKPCVNDYDRTYVSNELKKLITRVTSEGRLHVHRWDLERIHLIPSSSTTNISVSNNITNKKRKNEYDGNGTQNEYDYYGPSTTNTSPKNNQTNNNKKYKKSFEMENAVSDTSGYYGPNKSEYVSSKTKITQPFVVDNSHLQNRKNRFEKRNNNSKTEKIVYDNSLDSDFNSDTLIVTGTCQELEKDYFRLTSEPDPATVRPENVLIKAVNELKRKWKEKSVDYKYMCSQLKAVRQDFTVQKISNSFTVEAYEFHARVALEMEDLNEYNQCQTQLTPLYESGLNGSKAEFFAYLILYYVYAQGNKRFHTGNRDLTILLANLSMDIKEDCAIKHALAVRKAITFDNYHRFFKLYEETPNMGRHIINQMVEFRRIQALMTICRSYIPSVPLAFASKELAFTSIEDAKEYFEKIGCVFTSDDDVNCLEINTKDTNIDFEKAIGEDKPDLRFII
jgi:hypothetical protein